MNSSAKSIPRLPKTKPGSAEYRKRQAEIAAQHGLKVIRGHIQLPDLRIEYQTRDGADCEDGFGACHASLPGRPARRKSRSGIHVLRNQLEDAGAAQCRLR